MKLIQTALAEVFEGGNLVVKMALQHIMHDNTQTFVLHYRNEEEGDEMLAALSNHINNTSRKRPWEIAQELQNIDMPSPKNPPFLYILEMTKIQAKYEPSSTPDDETINTIALQAIMRSQHRQEASRIISLERSRGRILTGYQLIEILQNMYDNTVRYQQHTKHKTINNIEQKNNTTDEKEEQDWQPSNRYHKNKNNKRQRDEESKECDRKDCNRRNCKRKHPPSCQENKNCRTFECNKLHENRLCVLFALGEAGWTYKHNGQHVKCLFEDRCFNRHPKTVPSDYTPSPYYKTKGKDGKIQHILDVCHKVTEVGTFTTANSDELLQETNKLLAAADEVMKGK